MGLLNKKHAICSYKYKEQIACFHLHDKYYFNRLYSISVSNITMFFAYIKYIKTPIIIHATKLIKVSLERFKAKYIQLTIETIGKKGTREHGMVFSY